MPARNQVQCSQCGAHLVRVTWNYGKNRSITEFFCDNVCKGAWQREQRESLGYNKEWLVDQYINQRKSANQIAREIQRDSKRVWEWIKDYGFETRKRGTDYGQQFKPGTATMLGKKHTPETREKIRQAALNDGRKPWGKNNEPYWIGKTGQEHPAWQGGKTPERQAFYASDEWKSAVRAVWQRDNATCCQCGKSHNGDRSNGTFHIHHIVSFQVEEYRANLNNLVLLCKPCHQWVHSKKNTERKWIQKK